MDQLTNFQSQCESKLIEALKRINVALENRCLNGEREIYITAEIPSKDMKIFIYIDEPEFTVGESSYIFEVPDYRDVDLRISKFIDAVLSVQEGNLPEDTGSGRIALLKGKKL